MTKSNFTQEVLNDIHDFLKQTSKIFANERDFQMNLAVYLKSTKHYDVNVEYRVSSEIISSLLDPAIARRCTYYPWLQAKSDNPQEMYVDIVVSNGQEFVPVELKYKKREEMGSVVLFGQKMGKGIILKDDSAQDLGRYSFWKDVRRLEFLAQSFDNVKNGIAILVTNDASYKTDSCTETQSKNFAIGDGSETYHKDTNCCWPFNPLDAKSYKSYPSFKLAFEKEVIWNEYTNSGIIFHCAEVVI